MYCFGDFKFEGIKLCKFIKIFMGEMMVKVGDKDVCFIEVGLVYMCGDVLVYVFGDKVVYIGDILFIDGILIMWVGLVVNWIKVCDFIMDMDVDVIVLGYGLIMDK